MSIMPISREMIQSGELKRIIDEDGISGVTSNPTIFMKAIIGSRVYEDEIKRLAPQKMTAKQIYYSLTGSDIQTAADLLLPTYKRSNGFDGFVSVEVLPEFAYNPESTIMEAERLFEQENRDNVMVKIPGTPEGLEAIAELTARGRNVNATLLFSAGQYEPVARAYISGVKRRFHEGLDVANLVSVASVYLSRTDVKVDRTIGRLLSHPLENNRKRELEGLRGKTAIATAKAIYKKFKELFSSDEWKELEGAGARPQRPLWASMSPKEESADPLKYVEGVIGRMTISTLPMGTLFSFRERGCARPTLEEDMDSAFETLDRLRKAGVDIDKIYDQLQKETVIMFEHSYDLLMETINEERKRHSSA